MPRFSHCGLAVADLERTVRFYCEVLGFAPITPVLPVPAALSQQRPGEPERDISVRFIRKGDLVLELMHDTSAPLGGPARDRYGLRHFCFTVDDLDAFLGRVTEHGGSVVHEARLDAVLPDGTPMIVIFCRDPDGQPIEVTTASAAIARDYALLLQIEVQPPG